MQFYSTWLFIWFILFKLNIVKYNPLISIIIAFIFFSTLLFLYRKKLSKNVILLCIIQIFIIKLMPIFYLYKYTNKINFKVEIFGLIIYNLYLYLNHTNFINVYTKLFENLSNNTSGPFTSFCVNKFDNLFPLNKLKNGEKIL
jgi:hypothetical protein